MIEFSVVIPLYNKEKSIKTTLASVLNQSYPYFEVIIVNDGSTDKSAEIVEKFQDERIVLINKANGGVSSARNVGILNAKNDWIAFLDGDDLWHRDFLKIVFAEIGRNNGVQVFSTNCTINEADICKPAAIKQVYIVENFYKRLLSGHFINSSCAVVKKESLIKAGLFNENLTNGEDADLWERLHKDNNSFCFIDANLAVYRQNTENRAVGNPKIPIKQRAVGYVSVNFKMSKEERLYHESGIFGYLRLQIVGKNLFNAFKIIMKFHIFIVEFLIYRKTKKYDK